MNRAIVVLAALTLFFMSATVWGAPTPNLSATAPTQYENGDVIPSSDVLTFLVYCTDVDNGVYPFSYDATGLTTGGITIDISTCVQGVPGTYYFVATARSTTFNVESLYSNTTARTFTAGELGKAPNAPTMLTIAMVQEELVFAVS